MYRSLIFLALSFIAVTECCQPPPCHWSNAKPFEDYYDKVVALMIKADEKIQTHCQQNGSPSVIEDHKPKEYKLIYPADGDAFEIKVRNRAILVRSENCMGSLTDVRVLPPYVEPRGAQYTVEDGQQLIIRFPYKFDPVLGGGVCVPPDPSIITIQRGNLECTDCHNRIW